jgi:hypothetical protein
VPPTSLPPSQLPAYIDTTVIDSILTTLYKALDAQREARGLTWTAAVREIGGRGAGSIAVSTVKGLRTRTLAEADGVLQMLRWLDRAPESFATTAVIGATLPIVQGHGVLRVDTRALHAALSAKRVKRGLTWVQIAREIGGWQVGGLIRLSKGGRTAFPPVLRVTAWLGRPLAAFVRVRRR